MKKHFNIIVLSLILLFSLFLKSCFLNNCPDQIKIGKYYSRQDTTVVNYLELKPNGSFVHYYKEGKKELKHSGKWKRSKDDDCIIQFIDWRDFNKKGLKYRDLALGMLYINGDYLDDTPDGETNTSFKYISN